MNNKMKRKRFVKLLMANGLQRNEANRVARQIRDRRGIGVLLGANTTGLMLRADEFTQGYPDSWCTWWDKPHECVTEHEQEQCGEYGWTCESCTYWGEENV